MKEAAPIVLRIAVSLVFLWFGSQQIMNTKMWLSFVPDVAVSMSGLTASTLVHFNGALEIVFGLALIAGFFTRISALVLALHLFGITMTLGLSPIGVRDFGLSFATLAVFLYGCDSLSLDVRFKKTVSEESSPSVQS